MLKGSIPFQRKENRFHDSAFQVEKIVELGHEEFSKYKYDLLSDRDFIKENVDLMPGLRDGAMPVLLVLGEGHEDGILIDSGGYNYARYSALLPYARSILEQQNMSPALKDLNIRLNATANYAAADVRQQMEERGQATLSMDKAVRLHGMDPEGNTVLHDTLAEMIAERLDGLGIDMEQDKDEWIFHPQPRQEQGMEPSL